MDTTNLKLILELDVNHKILSSIDFEGRTPFHTLCIEAERKKFAEKLFLEIAGMLLESGVNLKIKDKYNRYATDYLMTSANLKDGIQKLISGKSMVIQKI